MQQLGGITMVLGKNKIDRIERWCRDNGVKFHISDSGQSFRFNVYGRQFTWYPERQRLTSGDCHKVIRRVGKLLSTLEAVLPPTADQLRYVRPAYQDRLDELLA